MTFHLYQYMIHLSPLEVFSFLPPSLFFYCLFVLFEAKNVKETEYNWKMVSFPSH